MALHAKNIALMAGAVGAEVALVADELVKQGSVRVDIAQAALAKLRSKPE